MEGGSPTCTPTLFTNMSCPSCAQCSGVQGQGGEGALSLQVLQGPWQATWYIQQSDGEPPGFLHPRSDPDRLSGSRVWPCSQKFAGPSHKLSFYHDHLSLVIDVLRSHCVSFPCLNSFHHHNPRTCTLIIPVLPVGKQAEQVSCHMPLTT